MAPPLAFDTAAHQTCGTATCFASFEAGTAREGEVRHCNRSGPSGGHAHRWDGGQWVVVDGQMKHDRHA
jgi:hypothetical protein